jgi:hypothetical protein
MVYLKHLTLNFTAVDQSRFIDGNHINNEIVSHMPQLNTFKFHIVTVGRTVDMEYEQSCDDIKYTFINWKRSEVKCYVDYFSNNIGKCHIYTCPYNFSYIDGVSNSFRGALFKNVTKMKLYDKRPFEYDFFEWISKACLYLRHLIIVNSTPQQHRCSNDATSRQHILPTIHYSHLICLILILGHIDYVDQFLHDEKTCIPNLGKLKIKYEHLVTVTNNFTNGKTRINCAKVKRLYVDESIVYPENFYHYFPLL